MLQVEKRGRKIIVDKEIKACDKCRCTWEKVNPRFYVRDHNIYPPGNIPRLGKELKTCPRCKVDATS